MVHVDLEAIAARRDLEDAPAVAGDLMVDAGHERLTAAILHFEYLDVGIEGVGARHVVIIFVAIPPDDSAGLHVVPGDRFEAHADIAIAEGGVSVRLKPVSGHY